MTEPTTQECLEWLNECEKHKDTLTRADASIYLKAIRAKLERHNDDKLDMVATKPMRSAEEWHNMWMKTKLGEQLEFIRAIQQDAIASVSGG